MDSGLVRAQGTLRPLTGQMSQEMNNGGLDKTDGGVWTRTRELEFDFWHCYIWCLISRHETGTWTCPQSLWVEFKELLKWQVAAASVCRTSCNAGSCLWAEKRTSEGRKTLPEISWKKMGWTSSSSVWKTLLALLYKLKTEVLVNWHFLKILVRFWFSAVIGAAVGWTGAPNSPVRTWLDSLLVTACTVDGIQVVPHRWLVVFLKGAFLQWAGTTCPEQTKLDVKVWASLESSLSPKNHGKCSTKNSKLGII